MCSKHGNHSRLNSQHDWADLYDYFMSRNTHLHWDTDKDICTSSEKYKANGYRHDLDLLIILH